MSHFKIFEDIAEGKGVKIIVRSMDMETNTSFTLYSSMKDTI